MEEREAIMIECARLVCAHCAGYTPPYEKQVEGPNVAGNYTHKNKNGRSEESLCAASSIWARIRFEKPQSHKCGFCGSPKEELTTNCKKCQSVFFDNE